MHLPVHFGPSFPPPHSPLAPGPPRAAAPAHSPPQNRASHQPAHQRAHSAHSSASAQCGRQIQPCP
ncbi:hypothetical protein BpHYR1_015350 [Brachionus plicatilis]|uniref:Uncharacterized protein n=1 Tax=Brachionus plicatilis TaxID=10195 RepID=A0A3M7T5L2_BRAPC|nr:hypothetical protein BpHYR1_015350 [Brachionus plicatilis]